uniref:Cnidarian restricted protein n=1 Tax=Clytia hemisphaerica TaxID=252671 RepID=A0A7M5WUW4_9CNID
MKLIFLTLLVSTLEVVLVDGYFSNLSELHGRKRSMRQFYDQLRRTTVNNQRDAQLENICRQITVICQQRLPSNSDDIIKQHGSDQNNMVEEIMANDYNIDDITGNEFVLAKVPKSLRSKANNKRLIKKR